MIWKVTFVVKVEGDGSTDEGRRQIMRKAIAVVSDPVEYFLARERGDYELVVEPYGSSEVTFT